MVFGYPLSEVQWSSSQHVTPESWALISGYETSKNVGEGLVISAFFQQPPVLFPACTVRPPLEHMGRGGWGRRRGEVERKIREGARKRAREMHAMRTKT